MIMLCFLGNAYYVGKQDVSCLFSITITPFLSSEGLPTLFLSPTFHIFMSNAQDALNEAQKVLEKAQTDISPYLDVPLKSLSSSLSSVENARLITMYTFVATSLMYCKYFNFLFSYAYFSILPPII